MKYTLSQDLLAVTRLTNAGRLTEATAAIQRALGGQTALNSTNTQDWRAPPTIDAAAEPEATAEARSAPQAAPMPGAGTGQRPFGNPHSTTGRPLPKVLHGFLHRADYSEFRLPGGGLAPLSPTAAPVSVPDGAQFLALTFSNQAGTRSYKLYVPSGYRGQPIPLVVMLHGCTQSPDDFAAGTRMNTAAEEHTCLVAYPGQTSAANRQKCWNWFSDSDQQRGRGEPSLIAGITREIMGHYAVDARRVYVAGLSAGGAAAAIMGNAYPDLYAAIGVHSGLACGAARDMPSAFAAMRQGKVGGLQSGTQRSVAAAIVFHGDRDGTVNPSNGDAVVAQVAHGAALRTDTTKGQDPGGHAYSRILHRDASGRTVIEQWVVHGAGHAWVGGSPAGSYTDPRGPDATREMLRFFLEHPHPIMPHTV